MSDPHEEGPVCDFCEIAVEPDETLEPIYVGELPQPKPHYLSGVREKGDNHHLIGKPISVYVALYDALRECRDIDVKLSEQVYEPEPRDFGQGVRGDVSFDDGLNRNKVGASVKIRPKDVTYDPDAEVCDTCAEMFRSLGSD